MFAAWARVVHRHRWLVLAGSLALLALSLVSLRQGGVLSSETDTTGQFQSQRATNLIRSETHGRQARGGSTFLLILRSPDRTASEPAFQADVGRAVAPLQHDSRVTSVLVPFSQPAEARTSMTSRDQHAVLVRVSVRDGVDRAATYVSALQREAQAQAPDLQVQSSGQVPVVHSLQSTLETDLSRGEMISLPVTLLLLLLVFGTVLAAGLPLGVGLLTIAGGIGATLGLSHVTDVSQYALNIVTLVGLGVSIDYSLFVVSRYREELRQGFSSVQALQTTLATAGRAVTFSGMTVAAGLGALLFFPGTYLTSMGLAGMLVVLVAVVYALTFLPAVLALLGPRVERLRIPLPRQRPEGGVWDRIARAVMRRPALALVPTLAVFLVAGVPFLHIRLASGGLEQLPPSSATRASYETLTRDFPNETGTSFQVVVRYPSGDPLSPSRTGQVYDLSHRIAAIPGVSQVQGPVDLAPGIDRAGYQQLYARPRSQLPAEVRQSLDESVGSHIVVLTAMSPDGSTSDGARRILSQIRSQQASGGEVLVTGETANDKDLVDFVLDHVPAAVGFVIGTTLVILFLLTGSVLLPIKAVLSNLVSISASFGAIVWIFQDGHLASQLGFTPQSIDPAVPVLLFATVFGLSMDYEVLLVTRIQEAYRATGDNRRAVAGGLARSGSLITAAAAIMVVVFLAFATSQIVLIKAIGLGLAIAVLLDATLIRALVVPSVMRLVGDANWWAPGPLRWLHDRASPGEGLRGAEYSGPAGPRPDPPRSPE
jgi:RND superfamily putative drug exporter